MIPRKILLSTTIVLFVFIAANLSSFGVFEGINLGIRDSFFRLRGPVPTNQQIVIVAIDDESIHRFGRWPWPRASIAALVHRLSQAGARTVGIDISFLSSQSQSRPRSLHRRLTPLLKWLGSPPIRTARYSDDQLLAMAIKKAGNVVLPFYFEFKPKADGTTREPPVPVAQSAYLLFDDITRLRSLPLLRGSSIFPPGPHLSEAAAALGCVNAFVGRDGVLRSDPALVAYGDNYFPSMGVQLVRLYLGLSWAEVKVNSGQSIQMDDHLVPIDDHGLLQINYYGGPGSFLHIPFKEVMTRKVERKLLQDKLVLVGVTAAGLHDQWPTPYGPGYPGVEKHATVAANILDNRFVVRSGLSSAAEALVMLFSALALAIAAGSRRSWAIWLLAIALLGFIVVAFFWAFTSHNLWFKPLFPALLIFVLAPVLQAMMIRLPSVQPALATQSGVTANQSITPEASPLSAKFLADLSEIGRYQVEGELGRGAMGVIYKAVDPTICRPVAIKSIRLDQTLEPEMIEGFRRRFLREAQVAGRLSHPNIVTIYDVVEKEGHLFIAMEYIEGRELSHFCDKDTLLGQRESVSIIAQVCEALDYAHRQGVVHRDIKPSNIMLLKNGRPKIMDFGITKLLSTDATQTAGMLGTPSYMSPEQIDCDEVDGRSDLFCVGITFYELLSGQRPFIGTSVGAILNQIIKADPEPLQIIRPEVHPELIAIVNMLLAKDRNQRYQSGKEVLTDLRRLLAEPSVWEQPAGTAKRARESTE